MNWMNIRPDLITFYLRGRHLIILDQIGPIYQRYHVKPDMALCRESLQGFQDPNTANSRYSYGRVEGEVRKNDAFQHLMRFSISKMSIANSIRSS